MCKEQWNYTYVTPTFRFMRELKLKEKEKDETIELAKSILAKAHPDAVPVIKHWISIIQSRWDEISSWAVQVTKIMIMKLIGQIDR